MHDNKWKPIKCILRPTACIVYKAKRAFFNFIVSRCIEFYDVNFAISPLGRPIRAEFTKRFSMKTSLINILCL